MFPVERLQNAASSTCKLVRSLLDLRLGKRSNGNTLLFFTLENMMSWIYMHDEIKIFLIRIDMRI